MIIPDAGFANSGRIQDRLLPNHGNGPIEHGNECMERARFIL